ncbi:glycosyltransferase [Bacillus cereus]|uniref:Glycosyltransferase family 1 protein n=1 Tax=Bacillus cereus TaxID=1396 RepID=A0AB34D1V4_BACCE|nr:MULTISPECIES: glycosyltransferase [Bacillus cereus group]KAB2491903.1 glycosyltransferase family 1 protein [Bacillus cereus]MBJ8201853.1 glycosyltransferase [Bacillus cereus]HDR8151851.1 glycosyltransferase [Bacillus cereus]
MNILMCEYLQYDTVFQVGSHYYAKEFLKENNNVVWANQPKPFFFGKEKNNKVPTTNLEIYNPNVLLPFCKYPGLNTKFWAEYHIKYPFSKVSSDLKKKEIDVMWLTNVKMYELANQLNYKFMIHRMADDFSGFKGAYKNLIYLQNQVVQKSNLVVVTAKNLVDVAYKHNKNVLYLPNGVNTNRFKGNVGDMPLEYQNLNRPVVVYVGAVEEWFDYELVIKAAEKLKEYAFVIIGNVNDKIRETFASNKNIHLLGKKSHDEIPKYLKHANVGIMPFVDNKLTNSIHPLKLYEYFAAGLPVVSRKLQEVVEMDSPAKLYKTNEEFITLIDEAIKETLNKEMFIEYAEHNTWEKRYEYLKQYINY